MEAAHVGVRTRARAMAMSRVTEEMVDGLGVVKRRKLNNEKLRSNFVQIKAHDECEINGNLVIEDELVAQVACCSSTGSTEKLKVLDLEAVSVESEKHKIERSKSTPKSNFKELESSELDSSKAKQLSETNKSSAKMPPEAELEEFFAAAQEDLNKRFKQKYNYDIVNDIPLKGRFEWIQFKPKMKTKTEDKDEDNR